MDDFVDFVSSIFDSDGGLIFIGILILLISYIAFRGFAGLGFWGKKRIKIAEYKFKNGDWTRRMFIYGLTGKNDYHGYGIELTNTKVKTRLGGIGMRMHGFAIEFTKDEADRLVDLIGPHLTENNSKTRSKTNCF